MQETEEVPSNLVTLPLPNDVHVEADNNFDGDGVHGSRVTCHEGKAVRWTDVLPEKVIFLVGGAGFFAAACRMSELYIFSPSGRRLLPCLRLDANAVALVAKGPFLLYLSMSGQLSVWDIARQSAVLSENRPQFLLDSPSSFLHAYVYLPVCLSPFHFSLLFFFFFSRTPAHSTWSTYPHPG